MRVGSIDFPIYASVMNTMRTWSSRLRSLQAVAFANDFSVWNDWEIKVTARPLLVFDSFVATYAKFCIVGDGKVCFVKAMFTINITTSGDSIFYVNLPINTTFMTGVQLINVETLSGFPVKSITGVVGNASTTPGMTIVDGTGVLLGTITFLVEGSYLIK